GSNLSPMGDRAGSPAGFPDGDRQQPARRNRADRGGGLSMDTAQGGLSRPMPDAVSVPDAPRWLSRPPARLPAAGASARRLLCRLLLGFDGASVRGRGDECALDYAFGTACPFGETYAGRTMDRAGCRHCMCGRGRLATGVVAAVMSKLSPDRGAGT